MGQAIGIMLPAKTTAAHMALMEPRTRGESRGTGGSRSEGHLYHACLPAEQAEEGEACLPEGSPSPRHKTSSAGAAASDQREGVRDAKRGNNLKRSSVGLGLFAVLGLAGVFSSFLLCPAKPS